MTETWLDPIPLATVTSFMRCKSASYWDLLVSTSRRRIVYSMRRSRRACNSVLSVSTRSRKDVSLATAVL